MGGRSKCGLWVGAAFSLLLACGDETNNMNGPGSEDPATGESKTTDGSGTTKDKDKMGGVAGSGPTVDGSKKPGTDPGKPGKKADEPLGDQTEFFSADTQNGGRNGSRSVAQGASASDSNAGTAGAAATAPTAGAATPTTSAASKAAEGVVTSVDRGDIFRVLGDKRILNLNQYRGLQVIDVSDVNKPRVEGRLQVTGSPVEMYVVGDRAFVLLNGWQGYYGTRDDLQVRSASGGLVMSVDIKDRANPKVIDQAEVNGNILTSRLTQGSDGKAALFVAASIYDAQAHSIIKSFEVSSGMLADKTEVDLGGYVQDVQATKDLMMVASVDYSKMQAISTVSLVDISHTDGTMVKGGSVTAQGIVQNKFNMDVYKGVLRVVSGANWNGAIENHLETWSIADLQKPARVDDCQLGHRNPTDPGSEQLYATVFIENRAFFVTYYRRDPFHAFSIDDAGNCAEHNEFIVSGWNDFLRPVLGNTRLIGVGHNDENNARLLAVSLYDAVNLNNTNPMFARAEIALDGAYSEGNWDDRAFSVLEGAVSVNAADGTEETGLVLLPFSGYDAAKQTSVSQVQLFTFSNHTLTKRGAMNHGSPVRRTFAVEADTTGNLSDETLSLFDTGNPNQPTELGRVDVAPSYSRVFVYGDHVARLHDNQTYYFVPQNGMSVPKSRVEIVSAKGDVDSNATLASFEVPSGATLTQVGNLLVSVYTETVFDSTGQNPKFNSNIQVFDLSDAQKPKARGTLATDRLEGGYYGGFFPGGGIAVKCFDCFYPRAQLQSYVVGDAIVFANLKQQQKSLGWVTQCDTYPVGRNCTWDNTNGTATCENPYYTGGISCITPDGGKESCQGEFYQCDDSKGGECKPVDPPAFTNRNCNRYEQFRTWQSYNFDALDLQNPDAPSLAKRIEMPTDEEGTSLLAVSDTLYFNFQKPVEKDGDTRSYVKHYVRMLGLGDPQKPAVGDPINIPGDVIAAMDSTLYTRDFVWKDNDARTMVARLTVKDGAAHLQASKTFEDRQVSAVKLDGAGHVLVSSDPFFSSVTPITAVPPTASRPRVAAGGTAGSSGPVPAPIEPQSQLSILGDQDLAVIGEANIDNWAQFQDAKRGRALYQVPGGLLVVDVLDPMKPKAQAYFAVNGWPSDIVFDGDSILFAAGMYGIYRLDATTFNLLMK